MTQSSTPEIDFATYNGGPFLTNAYAIFLPGQNSSQQKSDSKKECILIDAPEGTLDWVRENGWHVNTLLITHGHIDHMFDAAAIEREHHCPIYHHEDSLPFLNDKDAYRRYGIPMDVEPVTSGRFLNETPKVEFAGIPFRVLLVPGHCPGSLCFYHEASQSLFSGDTLMAGTIGRWDLPGGNQQQLLSLIAQKLLTLPPEVKVYSGHGPSTDIGTEIKTNPFFN